MQRSMIIFYVYLLLSVFNLKIVYGQLADSPAPKFRNNKRNTALSLYSVTLAQSISVSNVITNWTASSGGAIASSAIIDMNDNIYFGCNDNYFY